MARRWSRDVSVGVLFSLALTIVAVAVMVVGRESRLFGDKMGYTVTFPNADGLVVGSPVKMAGVQVGTVLGIQLPTDPEESGIRVRVGVDRMYAPRVREDSRAALRVLNFLTFEKAVEIIPGSPTVPPLGAGADIPIQVQPAIFEQAAVSAENLSQITVSLKSILASLEQGQGLMGQMISDPEFGKAGLDALRGAFENLRALTAGLREGKGFVGRMLQDEDFAARIDDLSRALTRIADVATEFSLSEGAVGAMLEEDGPGEQAIADLRDAAASLKRTALRLESRDSLLGQLLGQTEYEGDLALELGTVLENLARITDKIDRGEGTLGALVNERVLHDGMEDVVAGVNDSKFARWLLRHYQKNGIKSQESAADDALAGGSRR